MSDLKPCPFCGADPKEYAIEPHEHAIECECGVGLIDSTREEVLAMWNRRAAMSEGENK